MPRLTITIDDDQADLLNEKTGERGEYDSKSEAVRHFIDQYEEIEEHDRERQRAHDRELAELEREIRDLRTENERLRREKRMILEQREEHTDLVRAIERETTMEERRAQAGVFTRAKWWFTGMPDDE